MKKLVQASCTRGSVQGTLTLTKDQSDVGYMVNEDWLATLADIAKKKAETFHLPPPSIDGLLAAKGVIDIASAADDEDAVATLSAAVTAGFEIALSALVQAREEEGARIGDILSGQLASISALVNEAKEAVGDRAEALYNRFKSQTAKLLERDGLEVNEDMLAQEIAQISIKADVCEEIDRLEAHVESAQELLAAKDAIGRRFDFLCQEFNREANTLCSKASDIALTRVGLSLKAVIEQMREQVQNVE